jgi:hypothetical protein
MIHQPDTAMPGVRESAALVTEQLILQERR